MTTGLGVVLRQHSKALLGVRGAYEGTGFNYIDYDGRYPLSEWLLTNHSFVWVLILCVCVCVK